MIRVSMLPGHEVKIAQHGFHMQMAPVAPLASPVPDQAAIGGKKH